VSGARGVLICLSLLKDTIKTDTAADSASLKFERLRLVFFQPGPMVDGKFVGWGLFAIRTHCGTKEINVMGNVIYTAEGTRSRAQRPSEAGSNYRRASRPISS
jgi:hypothetical protein